MSNYKENCIGCKYNEKGGKCSHPDFFSFFWKLNFALGCDHRESKKQQSQYDYNDLYGK